MRGSKASSPERRTRRTMKKQRAAWLLRLLGLLRFVWCVVLPPPVACVLVALEQVFWDADQGVWVMFYFGLGDGTGGHADILVAFSRDLLTWERDPEPLYKAGGHPAGIDSQYAHKVSIIYHDGVGYLYYTAVGPAGRGIALLTSQPVRARQL